jgi:membrane-bound lytic murein transglycosylase D
MKGLMPTLQKSSFLRRRGLQLSVAALFISPCMALAATSNAPQQKAAPAQSTLAQQMMQDQQAAEARAAGGDHAQKVQDIINRAEASYKSGLDNYNANHLDAARLDFDAAVDLLLSSGMDLKNDSQLSDEFEDVLSRINSLELIALKQGNGFSPKVEDAPLDAANDITFAPDPVLVGKVTAELKTTTSDLPLVINEYVAGWINAFSNSPARRATLKRSLERAGKYRSMISRVLSDYGLPQDLIYQAITESGFQPQALNRSSGAGGMWQFMPFAGAYGLERNGYFDERFDPEKSTIAYAKYMKYLYTQFGDWYLAMAAYDWGPGRVQHVVSRTGYADYWELYRRGNLPAETKAYIPGLIAAIIMAKNPQQYGLTDLVPDAAVLSDKVTTNYAIDMRLVADLTNASVPEIVAINPALLRMSTPNDIAYDLHIPPGTKEVFLDRLKDIPESNRTSWRFHVVKDGETLDQIASTLHGRANEIAEYNELKPGIALEEGDELVVPVSVSSFARGQQRYTTRRGDTLVTIADRFGVTVADLRSWNRLSSNSVAPKRSIYVAEPLRLAPGARASKGRKGRMAAARAARSGRGRGESVRSSAHTKGGRATTSRSRGSSSERGGSSNAHRSSSNARGGSSNAHSKVSSHASRGASHAVPAKKKRR